MRFPRTLVIAATLVLLAACQGHEAPVTGAYGSQMVSGVVTMAAGMPNGSPAGMRVAVGGTGMSAVLGPDGRFSFFNVPQTAQLIFSRSDVNATLQVAASPAPLTIEVNSNSAHLGRQRTAPTSPFVEIEGVVQSASATQVVVQDRHGNNVTVVVGSNTVIVKGDQKVQATDLQKGDKVEIRATVSGTTDTAVFIEVEGGTQPSGNQVVEIEGVIQSASATQIVVQDAHGNSDTILIDANTVITKGGQTIQATDLKQGDRVHVKASVSGATTTALIIAVQAPASQFVEIEGVIQSASATQIVVKDAHGNSDTILIDANTVITKGGQTIQATDLKQGDRVHVKASVSGTTTTALVIVVQNTSSVGPMAAEGKVTAVGSNQLTVSTERGSVTVNVDSNTKIIKAGKSIALTDIKVGDHVACAGTPVDAQTLLAKLIVVESDN